MAATHQSANPWLKAGMSAAVSAAVCLCANGGWAQQLIPFADPAGQQLWSRASGQGDYGPLAQWFETQANLAYCGVASAVMVLNSLAVEAPPAQGYGSYRFWTQANAFSIPASRGFVRAEVVAKEGMTLAQLQGWLAQHPQLVVERFHADRLSLGQWRGLLRRSLKDPRDRLLVNYYRSALGQAGEGHISPVAAYDPHSDRALILDVARYRYPPVWVSAEVLWNAMRTTDSSSGRSRGLLVIRRR
ncbi:MAG: phytochelatin synthase family protein [Cyanobium sp.]